MDNREIDFVQDWRGRMVPAYEIERRHAWRKRLWRWVKEEGVEFCIAMMVLTSILGIISQ